MRKLTREDFINKAHHVHGNTYSYLLVDYKNSYTKISIVCSEHGEFFQTPSNHLTGQKCPICMSKVLTQEEWIIRANEVHSNKYDYSKSKYIDSRSYVSIVCIEHGEFSQRANDHIQGRGCSKCKYENLPQNQFKSQESWIEEANEVHDNKYDYSKVQYDGWLNKVIIGCPVHGDFKQQSGSHLQGVGCPSCRESHGERKISLYLNLNNIEYETQHKFVGCKYKRMLPFDFYIPKYNLLIEFDGIQHYEVIDHFGGIKALELTRIKDKIKTNYAKKNDIILLRISYFEIKNINNILNNFFKNK
jgi:very-short-patch-repair endonuclease